jgi:deazaflavin-dependent oxidoreductase (nitroreductase family)
MNEKKAPIYVPPKGTKGAFFPSGRVMNALAGPFMRGQVKKYSQASTPEPAKFMGFPILILTTTGARSGNEHSHVLGGFPEGPDSWLIIASKGGAATNPAWLHNIAKHPDKVWAQVGNRRFRADVESLRGPEREEAYARVAKVAPQYNGYLTKTDREIPVLRVTPAKD